MPTTLTTERQLQTSMLRTIMLLTPIVPHIVRILTELRARLTLDRDTATTLGRRSTVDQRAQSHTHVSEGVLDCDFAEVVAVSVGVTHDRLGRVGARVRPSDLAGVDHADVVPNAALVRHVRVLELHGRRIGHVGAPHFPADAHVWVVAEVVRRDGAGSENAEDFFGGSRDAWPWGVYNVAVD